MGVIRPGLYRPPHPKRESCTVSNMKRILLVDDEAHVLRVIKLSLDRNGFEVDTALSAEIALKMLRETEFDVVITDIDMPVMNGKELCETVARDFGADAPFAVVVTNAIDEEAKQWVANLSKTELVEKPMSLRWLVARLNEYFGHYDQAVNS